MSSQGAARAKERAPEPTSSTSAHAVARSAVGAPAHGHARSAPGLRVLQRDEPWEKLPEEWDALEPRGLYAGHLRTPLLWCVAACGALPALAVGVCIALVNAFVIGSPRQVLFGQERVGRRGRVFRLWKFRTMRGTAADGSDEERVTRFGRLLRNSHLDELPQLINVLRGEMCLIGPRPEMVEIERWAVDAVPGFEERLALTPGLTGWAQITQGYAAQDAEAYALKRDKNREYAARISPAGDVAILLRTVSWVLKRKGWWPSGKRA